MVKVKEDLTGKRFGKLTVIEQAEDYVSPKKIHYSQWKCKCDCGNEAIVNNYDLRSGHTKSCGCLKKRNADKVVVNEDLTGKKFGRLTVIEQSDDKIEYNGKHRANWRCKCDCGNIIDVTSTLLTSGKTISCGCSRRKYNIYEFYDNYGICYTEDKKNYWIFDLEDYEKIKDFYWLGKEYHINNQIVYYAYATDKNSHITVTMPRIIMGLKQGDVSRVDHINHNIYDNRKKNLRICSISQNNKNRTIYKNNTSGYTGIRFKDNKWIASIGINNQKIYLGYYNKIEDAIKARKEAEEKYFGEYSYDNSIRKVDNVI